MKNLLLLIVGLVALTMFSSCSQSGRRASELSTSVQYVVELTNDTKVVTKLSSNHYKVGDVITVTLSGGDKFWEIDNRGIYLEDVTGDIYYREGSGIITKVIPYTN